MSLFSAGLAIRPNPLNFTEIYRVDSWYKIKQNPIMALFALNILFFWAAVSVYAYRRNLKNQERPQIEPTLDISPYSKYFYRVVFYTGDRRKRFDSGARESVSSSTLRIFIKI